MNIEGREVYYSRSQVRTVECPVCRAQPGQKCLRTRGKARESNHFERVIRYDERVTKGTTHGNS